MQNVHNLNSSLASRKDFCFAKGPQRSNLQAEPGGASLAVSALTQSIRIPDIQKMQRKVSFNSITRFAIDDFFFLRSRPPPDSPPPANADGLRVHGPGDNEILQDLL